MAHSFQVVPPHPLPFIPLKQNKQSKQNKTKQQSTSHHPSSPPPPPLLLPYPRPHKLLKCHEKKFSHKDQRNIDVTIIFKLVLCTSFASF
ncbi:hypothetical protein K440DRAFT_616051 [Wilcoxina mikolae CBS 423.85]|nr:hypothetical protein K440DRAFT_616051 [Wilcoxina mikolae CBS 423.85]